MSKNKGKKQGKTTRKSGDAFQNFTLRLSPTTLRALKAKARSAKRSISEILRGQAALEQPARKRGKKREKQGSLL